MCDEWLAYPGEIRGAGGFDPRHRGSGDGQPGLRLSRPVLVFVRLIFGLIGFEWGWYAGIVRVMRCRS
ncbi:hypothetical protein PSEUDO8O_120112 [Pseudomonas sp. 8O]|nr:hypothetical protein PSEUDO8O_120112 [Pseudomonas sp. 8O]